MKAQKIFVKFSILMLFLLAGPSPGLGANDEALPLSSQIMEMVENAQAELTRGSLSSDGFQRLKEKTDQFDTKVKGQLDISQAKREAIKAQLEALGPPPDVEKGEEEPVDLAQSRKSITASLRKIQAELAELRLAEVRITELATKLSDASEENFVTNLITRQPSVFSSSFWEGDFSALSEVAQKTSSFVVDQGQALASMLAILILLAVTLFVQHGTSRMADRMAGQPQRYQHMRAAILLLLSRIIPTALFIFFSDLVLVGLGGFSEEATNALVAILTAATIAWISVGIITSFLSPARAQLRPIRLPDEDVLKLRWPASILVALLAVADSLFGIMEALSLERMVATFPLTFMLATSAILVVQLTRHLHHRHNTGRSPTGLRRQGDTKRKLMHITGLGLRVVGVFCLVATLAGYYNAASYFLDAMVRSVLVVVLAIYVHLIIVEILRSLRMAMGKQPQTSERETRPSAVLVFLFDVLIVIGTILVITHLWGAFGNHVGELVSRLIFGIEIGGVSLSLIGVSMGVGVFVLLIWLTKSVQKILSDRVLPGTQLDSSAQDSLRQSLGYVGFILAAIIALSTAGVNLSNFALIASALSVGIGFGMQTIVNNFVSGLILLAERPIKVGDWVVAGGTEGYVRRISVRATEIETFDRASVIVPNAELVAQPVTNWFYKNRQGRVVINIGVAYGSDVSKVKKILLEVAHGHDKVLNFPEPNVYFMDFADSSLNFSLRCYIGDYGQVLTVSSDLRFAVDAAFARHKIEIPFPQRDLHLRSVPEGLGTMDRS